MKTFVRRSSLIVALLAVANLFAVIKIAAQTNPAAQTLPYSQNFNSLEHSSTTYPAGWQGWQLATTSSGSFRTTAPTGDHTLTASSSASTTATGVHNFNGKIGFLSGGSGTTDPSIVLAINTTGQSNINVVYNVMTIRNPYDGGSNTRINEVTLQYRIGTSGSFTTISGLEYQNNTTAQTTSGLTTPQKLENRVVQLPAACNNEAVVQLRWVQRDVSGAGFRPSFAIDDINITTGSPTANFNASGTFTVPAGVYSITVEAWGGGGAGGRAATNGQNIATGGGGGGGAYAKKILSVTPGTTYTVTVAGIKTSSTTDNGPAANNGNPSIFSLGATEHVKAMGGAGGTGFSANGGGHAAGATGSLSGSIGDVVYGGGAGGTGNTTSSGAGGGGAGSTGAGGNASVGTAGTGTSLNGGNGGSGQTSFEVGNDGNNYGGGGSGARTQGNTNRAGGSGAPGLVVVSWTACPTITATISGANTICTGASTNLVVTITGGTGPYTVVYTDGSTNTTVSSYSSGSNISVSPSSTKTYTLVSVTDANGCPATVSGSATVTVVAQPSAPGLATKTPNTTSVCAGTLVSATFTPGSGGTGCVDIFQYSTDNGSTWSPYTPGNNINTTGSTGVIIQGMRTNCTTGSGCLSTEWFNLASWVVNSNPSCSITGANGPLCPSSTGHVYSGPAGMSSYLWSISGNGSISGANDAVNVTVNAGSACGSSFTLTLTVTDANGCTATCSKTVTVNDTQAPEFANCPASAINLGCNPAAVTASQAITAAGSVTDNCNVASVTATAGGISGGCVKTQTWTVTATDDCGNTATCAVTYTWTDDTTPPVFTGDYGTVALTCNPTAAAIEAALGSASATDNCGSASISSTDGAVSGGCFKSQTRTFTATDACGNTSTVSRTVTWTDDTTPPVFTGDYSAVALTCNPTAAAIEAALGSASATDNCGSASISSTDGAVSGGCFKSQTRTFTATDACGNTSTVSRTVTWTDDTTPPVFTGDYGTVALTCNPTAAAIEAALGSASATDNCGSASISSTDGAVSGGCFKSQTRTFTATDACGNTSTVSRTVTWTDDTTPPVFTGDYGTVALTCNPTAAAIEAALGSASATDNCGSASISSTDGAVSGGCFKSQTRTFTATDACGNTSTISRTVTWTDDTTPPVFTGDYSTVALACNPTAAAIEAALGSASATDNCGSASISSTDGAVSGGCFKSQTRTFTATDACGNTSTVSRTVTWTDDTTPPVFTGDYSTVALTCNPTAAAIEAALGSASATDNCGSASISSTDGAVSGGCFKSQTRTFTATDACGNTSTVSRTVTWTDDTTPPVFTGDYGTVALTCNPTAAAIEAALGSASATDNCGSASISSTDGAVSGGCFKSQTRTFTATDACGNTSTISRTVTWTDDTTPPVFTGDYSTVALACNPTTAAIEAALGSASATDNCGSASISSTDGAVSGGCFKSQTRTFTATDACGNTSTISRTVTWTDDTTPPVFTGDYSTVALACNPTTAAIEAALGSASATDNCGSASISSTDGAVSGGCFKSQTRTFTATDACGNTSTISRTVTWTDDTTPPVFTGDYSTVALTCNPTAAAIEAALGSASATDNCGSASISSTDGAVSGGCFKSQTRTFTATDACGNTSTISRTVTWTDDTTPPVFTGDYSTVALACNPTAAAIEAALGSASATDNCGSASISSTDGAVSGGCFKSQTRTFTATDACGNTSTISRTVTWTDDTTPPVFTGDYSTVALACNPTTAAIEAALGSASATDNCGSASISSTDGAVSGGCFKSQTRTFTATDACGNTSTISRTVTWTDDTTPPVFTGDYSTVALACNPTAAAIEAALGSASATDNCGSASISSTDGAVSGGCFKSQTRTFTATDGCGNTTTISRTVTWTDDTTPPVFTGDYSTVALTCNPTAAAIEAALGSASATDNCGSASISSTDGAVSGGCFKSQTRTFTATDACGNTSTISRTVTWTDDTTPPVFTGDYSTVALACNPTTAAIEAALGSASATDNCGSASISSTDGAVSGGCFKSQTRTFTATDACGNTSTISRTVTWTDDTTPPVFTGDYSAVALTCNPTAAAIEAALGSASATDNCGSASISSTDGAVSGGCFKSQTRTFTATDACGNTSTVSRTVTWTDDTTPPVIGTAASNSTVECDGAGNTTAFNNWLSSQGGASATDNCSGVTWSHDYSAANWVTVCGNAKYVTVVFTATDACNNSSSTSATFTIEDTTPPVIGTAASNSTVECDGAGNTTAFNTWLSSHGGALASDACGSGVTWSKDYSAANWVTVCGNAKYVTVVFTATDACNNSSSTSATFTIADTQAPIISGCPAAPVVVYTGAGNLTCTQTATWTEPTANDVCGGATSYSYRSHAPGATFGLGNTTVTYVFTDDCGNANTCSFTVTVIDNTPPTISCPADKSVSTDAGVCTALVSGLGATYDDNCSVSKLTWSMSGATTGSSPATGINNLSSHTFNKGVTTVTYTVTDGSNNTATCSFTVTVSDNEPPLITCTANKTVSTDLNVCTYTKTGADWNAVPTDNCTTVSIAYVLSGATTGSGTSLNGVTFNKGLTNVIWTATDGSGNTATCSFTVTVNDTQAPSLVCGYTNINATFNPLVCGAVVNYTPPMGTDNCPGAVTTQIAGLPDGSTFPIGVTTNTFFVTDASGNTATCSFTVTVNALAVTPVMTLTPSTQQYSDEVQFKVVIPNGVSTCGNAAESATFTVTKNSTSQVMGTANFIANGNDLEASLTAALFENPNSSLFDPNNNTKTVSAVLNNVNNTIYSVGAVANQNLTVTREDANVAYFGAEYFTTPSASNCTGTLTFGASVIDKPDGSRGDIRKATIKFTTDLAGTTLFPGTSASNPVGLVNPGNIHEGISVTPPFNVTLTGSQCSESGTTYEVYVHANNYYTGYTPDATLITLALPGQDNVTGGGHLNITNSAGCLAATAGSKMNFGMTMKRNKSGKNLQGQITILFRKLVGGTWKTYKIKSNAINSMNVQVNGGYNVAIISTKANLSDVTDPLNPISLGGNLNLTVEAWDLIGSGGGQQDKIAVSLTGSISGCPSNSLIFSSHWTGTGTAAQILGGGNINVSNNSTANPPITNLRTEIVHEQPVIEKLALKAYPNPSSSHFVLKVESNNTKDAMTLRIMNTNGRVIQIFGNLSPGQVVRTGDGWIHGMYYAELLQGDKRTTLKLVKQ